MLSTWKYKLVLVLAGVNLFLPTTAHAESVTFQGRVSDASGNPLTGSATLFRVQILSPNASRCVLYDETHTVNLAASYGLFSINLNDGNGTRSLPTTYSLDQAISNRTGFTVDASYCAGGGSGTVTYSPVPGDNRKVVIQFRDPVKMGATWETIPEMDLNPVPYAIETRTLGGFPASSVVRVQDAGNPSPAPILTTGQVTELQSLINGSSNNYMSSTAGSTTGARMPTVSGRPSTPGVGSVWYDTITGTVKYFNGSSDQTLGVGSASGGTITSVNPGTGIATSVTGSAVTVALSPSGVGAAGTVGSASAIPEINYDSYGRITAVTSHAISGLLPAAGVDHQVLKSTSGAWGADFIGKADLRVSAGQELFPGTCNVNQTINFDSVAGRFVCQDVGGITSAQLAAASGTAVGTYRSVSINAAGQVLSGTNPTDLAGYAISDAVRNGGSVPQIRSGAADPSGAGVDGELYVATTSQKIFRYNLGTTTWETMASAGGAGGTVTGITAGSGIAVSGSATTPTVSLSTAGVTAGAFAKVTTDAYGRVTSGSAQVSNADIADVDFSKLTGKPATLLGHGITEALVGNAGGAASLQAGATGGRPSPGTAGQIYIDTDTNTVYYRGASAWQTVASAAGSGGTLTEVYSGAGVSVTGSGTTRTVSLTDVGTSSTGLVKINTDAKGRVTGGASTIGNAEISDLAFSKLTGKPTDLGGYGITDAVKNPDGTVPTILSGTDLGKPPAAAGNLNFIYIANDTFRIYRQIGGTWQVIGAGTPANFSGALAGEVSGTQSATQVDQIGSFLRATMLSLFTNVQNATDVKTNGAIVKRDGAGGFAAGAVTADTIVLKGATSGTATLRAPAAVTTYDVQLPSAAPTAGQVLSATSGTALTWTTPLSGSTINVAAPITNTSGTIGINTASGSQAGALSSGDWTTFNNKLGTALTAASIWVGNASNVATAVAPSGDVAVSNAGAFTVNGIKGQNISAVGASAGQVLRYAGSNTWTPNFVSMADLRSTVTGTSAITGNCTASQTLTWNSGSDNLQCQSISIAAATQITGMLPVANGGTGAATTSQGFVFAGPSSGAGAPAFRALAASDLAGLANQWDEASGSVFRNSGNVGIGTASPGKLLELRQSTAAGSAIDNTIMLRLMNSDNTGTILTPSAAGIGFGFSGTRQAIVGGTYGNDFLDFYTGGSLTSPRVRIDSLGNVGIGTPAPTAPLQVNGSGGIRVADSSSVGLGSVYNDGGMHIAAEGTTNGNLFLSSTAAVYFRPTAAGTATALISTGTGNSYFNTGGGNVSIGTSANGTGKLRVENAYSVTNPENPWLSPLLNLKNPDTTDGNFKSLLFTTTGTNSNEYTTAALVSRVNSHTPASLSADLLLGTALNGTYSTKLTVKDSGRIGIGTTAPQAGLDIATTGAASALIVPRDNSTNRPTGVAAVNGMIRYNTTSNALEAYINNAWSNLATIGGSSTFTTVGAGAGSAGSPSLSFSGDTNTGFYNANSDDKISVATGGTKIFDFSSSGLVSPTTGGAAVSSANGTAATPTYGFAGEAGLGWYRPTTATLAAATGSTERMRIDSSGYVGIGTSSPAYPLDVFGGYIRSRSEGAYGGFLSQVFASFAGTSSEIVLSKARGTVAAPAHPLSGDTIGSLVFRNGVIGQNAAFITSYAAENHSATATGGNLAFLTTANTTTGSIERMRIESNGNVGIGSASPTSKLDVFGNITNGGMDFYLGNSDQVGRGNSGMSRALVKDSGTILVANYNGDFTGGTAIRGASNTTNLFVSGAANGNVGVGTTSPGAALQINRSAGTATPLLILENPHATSQTQLQFRNNGTPTGTIRSDYLGNLILNSELSGAIYYGLDNSGLSAHRFFTNGAERVTVTSGGNVGIGTNTPSAYLEVQRPTAAGHGLIAQFTGYSANANMKVSTLSDGSGVNLDVSETSTGNAAKALTFSTGGATNEKMRILAGGNVGIGTTSPAVKLTVDGRIYSDQDALNGVAATNAISAIRNAADDGIRYTQHNVGAIWMGHSTVGILGTDAADLTFKTGISNGGAVGTTGSERMRIKTNGNVGIGTTNPTGKLSVNGNVYIDNIGFGGIPTISLAVGDTDTGLNSTYDGNLDVYSNSVRAMSFRGANVGIGTSVPGYPLEVRNTTASAIYGQTSSSGAHGLWGDASDPSSAGVIGRNTNTGSYGYIGHGGWGVNCAGGACGGNQAWSNYSDARLKTEVQPVASALDKVLKLRGVSYRWIDKKRDAKEGQKLGLIAQEVEKIFPQSISTDTTTSKLPGGTKMIAYTDLIGPMVEAIKEFYAKWEADHVKTEAHERAIASLKTENEKIRAEAKTAHEANQKLENDMKALKAYLCAKDPSAPLCPKK